MGTLTILQKSQNHRACLENKILPANYMADYSVMGLVVGRLDKALRILKEKKVEFRQKADGLEINIDGASRLSELVSMLQQNRIDCTMADIVDQVYQG